MQVDDEDDIDIGGNEGVSVATNLDVVAESRHPNFEVPESMDTSDDTVQHTVHIAPDYQEPSWDSYPSIDTSDMDEKSKALIQQMLAEEEYYFGAGTNSLDHDDYPEPKPKKRKIQKRDTKGAQAGDANHKPVSQDGYGKPTISSAELPSHKTRWSAEEDQKLKDALAKYNYGNWKAVAEAVGTRNPLQCKNHARHLVNSSKITPSEANAGLDIASTKETSTESLASDDIQAFPDHQPPTNTPNNTTESVIENVTPLKAEHEKLSPVLEDEEDAGGDDIEVDIDENGHAEQITGGSENTSVHGHYEPPSESEIKLEEPPASSLQPSVGELTAEKMAMEAEDDITTQDDKKETSSDLGTLKGSMAPKKLDLKENGAAEIQHNVGEHVNENGHQKDTATIMTSGSKEMTLISDIPRKVEEVEEDEEGVAEHATQSLEVSDDDKQFDPHNASEEEIKNNREWFLGKSSKTPERYLKIRNTMLAAWKRCKPRYLTKTSARNGLKDCGDVNAIGRVHSYLESIGAINVGCITNPPRPKRPAVSHVEYFSDEDEQGVGQVADWLMEYEGPRKRKVRDEKGQWVDPKDLEGRVIEHGVKVEEVKSRPKRTIRRPRHLQDNDFHNGYDPFRLVPLEQYDEQSPPFKVTVVSDALIVMDFHSYLAHTEIIGLLGGKFDVKERCLEVQCTFPCKSTSTGIQCEMDPESEMRAREVFAEKGMTVVGWYHSHPTFEPNPSVRDIENQSSYQSLFRDEETGLEPFIGVIISPYDDTPETNVSKFQYLSISAGWDSSGSFRMPFACAKEILQRDKPASDLYPQLHALVDEYCDYEHRVNMFEPFPKDGSKSRLDKLLASLSAHLVPDSSESNEFLDQIRRLVTEDLPPPPPKGGRAESPSENDGTSKTLPSANTNAEIATGSEGQAPS